jgi:hypothetical protein
MTIGYDKRLYVLPFDHRATFSKTMFGWQGPLSQEQTAQIAAAKQVIYDGFKEAVAGGVKKEYAGILVDETFATPRRRGPLRPAPRRRAAWTSSTSSMGRTLVATSTSSIPPSARCWCATMRRVTRN